MTRANALVRLGALSMVMGLAAPALAENEDDHKWPVEFTLFGGYRSSGTFDETTSVAAPGGTTNDVISNARLKESASFGVAVNWESEADSVYELGYSRQSSTLEASTPLDMRVEYLQIGGYTTFSEVRSRAIPFFLMTVGAARFTPDSSTLDALTKPAAAVGGGVKFPITSYLALRLDARVYATFFQGRTDLFCHGSGGVTCQLHLQGGTFLQPDASLGISVRF